MAIVFNAILAVRGLPPILLTPLYWLEKDTPVFFTQRIQPLLQKHLG